MGTGPTKLFIQLINCICLELLGGDEKEMYNTANSCHKMNNAIRDLRTNYFPVTFYSFLSLHWDITLKSLPSARVWTIRGKSCVSLVDGGLKVICVTQGRHKTCGPPNYLFMVAAMAASQYCSLAGQCMLQCRRNMGRLSIHLKNSSHLLIFSLFLYSSTYET